LRLLLTCLVSVAFLLVSPIAQSRQLADQPALTPARHAPVLVAVIDSGIARTAALRDVLVGDFDMAMRPARPAYRPRYDHGTMVATILKREAHVPIRIISLRIDDPAGCPAGAVPPCQSAAEPVIAAIHEAIARGADAINISLALKDDPAIVAAIHDATKRGIVVVLAAGNRGSDRPDNLEAAKAGFPNAILVGALDQTGRPWRGTNRPPFVPRGYLYSWQEGVAVPTTSASGAPVVATGTSFAVPIETARQLEARGGSYPNYAAADVQDQSDRLR
jgi:subtilisin family serine protease